MRWPRLLHSRLEEWLAMTGWGETGGSIGCKVISETEVTAPTQVAEVGYIIMVRREYSGGFIMWVGTSWGIVTEM
jgi:hypothetical protein